MILRILVVTLLISIATPTLASSAKVYVWRNEQGVLVFSDSPRPGAEEVDVKSDNVIQSSVDTSILDITPKEIKDDYEVVINQPENHSTIRDNTGSVHVIGSIKPIFKRGLKVQLYLDNEPYEKPQPHSSFALRDVDRGEHQIKMELINNKGKVIALSEQVTFYMHRATVQNKAK